MHLEVVGQGAFQYLKVHLERGDEFISEAGKMVRMSIGIDTDVTMRSKGKGGLGAALKRLVGGDSMFMSTYRTAGGGEVVLAPDLIGEVSVIELDGHTTWMCAGGSYMANGPGVAMEPKWQGAKGLFSGESLFFLEAEGSGPVVVNAFGSIRETIVDGELIVDTGHVVAFESTLDYEITKAGKSWIQSFLAGEGFVMRFTGNGRMLIQSHNPSEFGKFLGPKLPPRG